MSRLRTDLEELLKRHPDPRLGAWGLSEFRRRCEAGEYRLCLGTVSDNRDPQCLGRVRVCCDMAAAGTVTGWIQTAGPWRGGHSGWWQLPDVGVQALVVFPSGGYGEPVCLGYIYDEKHRPPQRRCGEGKGSIVCQKGKHRLEFCEEQDRQSLEIHSADGKMRYVMRKGEGIELINELGDIRIKCRKMRVKGQSVGIQGKKQAKAGSGGSMRVEVKKAVMESDGEVSVQGKNVRLHGKKGVTAQGKALAAEGSRVMGYDIHQMEIPCGTGSAVVLLPHPFIGRIREKVSGDVKVGGSGAAVKGSVAKHDEGSHMQLAGTIRFVNGAEKKGEVTGGTAGKVKINGKEAAVAGSTVSTCNDVGMKDNSVVLAAGAGLPVAGVIRLEQGEEGEGGEEEEKKERKFTDVKWGKEKVREGEEVEVRAWVQGIGEGNTVTFQVYREGEEPGVHVELGRVVSEVKGGEARGVWRYCRGCGEEVSEEDPKFIFSAHSAWCGYEKSGTVTVELDRPELSGARWSSSEALVGEALGMSVECRDMEDGEGVTFSVYNSQSGQKVMDTGSVVKDGKAEGVWTYHYRHGKEAPLREKPKFYFTAEGQRCRQAKSGETEIGAKIEILLHNEIECEVKGFAVSLIQNGDTDCSEKVSFNRGKIEKESMIPGEYVLHFEIDEKKDKDESYEDELPCETEEHMRRYDEIMNNDIKLNIEKTNVVVIVNPEHKGSQ